MTLCTPSQSLGLFMGGRCSGVECHYVFLLLIPWLRAIQSWWLRLLFRFLCPLIFISTYTFRHFETGLFGSVTTYLSGCFCPENFLNIELNMIPSHSFLLCLGSLLGYSTGEFATNCPCGVWCRVSTTCLLYVGPPFGNVVGNDSEFVNFTL